MVKQLQKDLKAFSKSLKQIALKTEKLAKQLDKLEKKKPAAKPKAAKKKVKAKAVRKPAAKRAAKATGVDAILKAIQRSKKGIDAAALKQKTGIKDNNIRTYIYRLKKRGLIKAEKKGLYTKA